MATGLSARLAWQLAVASLLAGGVFVAACGSDPGSDVNGAGRDLGDAAGSDSCATPQQGCPCSVEGQQVDCGEVIRRSGDYVACSMGKRTCTGGQWGACVGTQYSIKSLLGSQIGEKIEGIGTPSQCKPGVNDCDPYCWGFPGDGSGQNCAGLDGSAGTQCSDGGLTLTASEAGACTGIQCNIANCGGGITTDVSGTVYDPAGLNPLFNIVVYVPNDVPSIVPFARGVTCDACGGAGQIQGSPITSALTDIDGKFVLHGVPTGANIPLVIQIGRWRRLFYLPSVTSCVNNTYNNIKFSLPSKGSQGDMPWIAFASGDADPFQCMLLKMGIDSSEFVSPGGPGHVDYYVANGDPLSGGTNPPVNNLTGSLATLNKYQMAILACEGFEDFSNIAGNLYTYANAGGKAFLTHYSYTYLQQAPAPWPTAGNFVCPGCGGVGDPDPGVYNTALPKVKNFQQWMINRGATTLWNGQQITWIYNPRDNYSSVTNPNTELWMRDGYTGASPLDMAFNTPYAQANPPPCGRVVYTDFHVSYNAINPNACVCTSWWWGFCLNFSCPFPAECYLGALSPQEKALEYMFFDLSSCVGNIQPPTPPYQSASYTVQYQATCPAGTVPKWGDFEWSDSTPSDSNIVFAVQTAATQAGIAAAPKVPLATVSTANGNSSLATWPNAANVANALQSFNPAQNPSLAVLQIDMTLNPSTDKKSGPTLAQWRQLYSCVPSE